MVTPLASQPVHHERELKWHLDRQQYHFLLQEAGAAFGPPRRLQQVNCFLDSADGRLRAQHMSIRLRRENQHLLLTAKCRRQRHGALHHQEEEERWLNSALWGQVQLQQGLATHTLPLSQRFLTTLGGQPLIIIGGFANLRQQWAVDGDLLCLDHSRFTPVHQDYEVEIEISDSEQGPARWQAWLEQRGLQLEPQLRSKLQRLMEGPV